MPPLPPLAPAPVAALASVEEAVDPPLAAEVEVEVDVEPVADVELPTAVESVPADVEPSAVDVEVPLADVVPPEVIPPEVACWAEAALGSSLLQLGSTTATHNARMGEENWFTVDSGIVALLELLCDARLSPRSR